MPIKHHTSGLTLITGDSIDFFRLAVIKSAVFLETKGIKHRQGCQWKLAHAYYKLTCKKTAKATLVALEALLTEERPKQLHITEDGTKIVDGKCVS